MQEKSYPAILWHRKWLIAATLVATVIVALIGTLLVTPTYQASVRLRVFTAARGSVDWVDYDIAYTERLMNTYSQLATSGPVLQELGQQMSLSRLPEIRAEVIPDTELMQITVEGTDPVLVTGVANGLAQVLVVRSQDQGEGRTAQNILGEQLTQAEEELAQAQVEYTDALAQTPEDSARVAALARSVEVKQEVYTSLLQQFERTRVAEELRANALSIAEPATLPQAPYKPDLVLNLMLSVLVGLVAGAVLAFVFERLDTRLRSTEEIEQVTGLPAVGRIPYVRNWPSHVFLSGSSPEQEAYRRLQARLDALARDSGLRTFLVTSSEPGEGKSTIVANLAQALAQSGRRVVVVDTNLRRPVLHRLFDMANEVGLSNVLAQEWSLKEAIQSSRIPGVWVLTSGAMRANPAQLLALPRMATILEELTHPFDVILLDSPSVLAVADAALLAPMVDGVLLVVGRGQTSAELAQSALEQLTDVQARVLGVVVNWARRTQDWRDYKYYNQGIPKQKQEPALRRVPAPVPEQASRTANEGALRKATFVTVPHAAHAGSKEQGRDDGAGQ